MKWSDADADGCQLYGATEASDSEALSLRTLQVVAAVSAWMAPNRLRLNEDKTQYMWFGSRQQLAKRDVKRLASILPSLIESTSARDLGVILDSELSFEKHVTKIDSNVFLPPKTFANYQKIVVSGCSPHSCSFVYLQPN